jgi:hypothetical protein
VPFYPLYSLRARPRVGKPAPPFPALRFRAPAPLGRDGAFRSPSPSFAGSLLFSNCTAQDGEMDKKANIIRQKQRMATDAPAPFQKERRYALRDADNSCKTHAKNAPIRQIARGCRLAASFLSNVQGTIHLSHSLFTTLH